MILYHGSNVEVRQPRLLKNQRELDFGKGFYTTSDMDQASRWAKRTARRVRADKGYVSVYEIDDELMQTLHILRFEKTDAEWLRFVVDNRNRCDQRITLGSDLRACGQ